MAARSEKHGVVLANGFGWKYNFCGGRKKMLTPRGALLLSVVDIVIIYLTQHNIYALKFE